MVMKSLGLTTMDHAAPAGVCAVAFLCGGGQTLSLRLKSFIFAWEIVQELQSEL